MCFQKLKKFRRKKNTALLLICVITSVYIVKNHLHPSAIVLAEFNKCPACYGTSACSDVFTEKIKIQPFNAYTTMSHLFSAKNVFFGEFNGEKVVIKKLAHYEELDAFDRMICEESLDCCTVKKHQKQNDQTTDYFSRISTDISSDFINDDKSGLILCPNSTAIFLNKLKHLLSHRLNDANLWTLIRVNPEPILLQILRAEEGWPVPKYYGACGRIIIEEYAGLPLTAYYHSPWILRAKIAAGLLDIAQMFTFYHSEFSYYLTDLTPDNIAINKEHRPVVVDLENVIITSKINISIKDIHKNLQIHNSEQTVDCENCFVFSPLDICNHPISDHNYYAICKHILSSESGTVIPGGFLHHVPKDISSRYPDLKIMLAQCSVPSRNETRVEIAYKLKKLLKEISNSYQRLV